MSNTKANLHPATIVALPEGRLKPVECMFNPHEYTLTKQNQWENKPVKGVNVPNVQFKQGGPESLKLQLFFDTFDLGTDVRANTDPLWQMMLVTQDKKMKNNKSRPPNVEFRWGKFSFKAVILSLSQTFTLFDKDGVPLRTTVDVTFQQVTDDQNPARQNPTSGGGPPVQVHIVQAGDRLDLIANEVYGDATLWRMIARENHLFHPLKLREGQELVIPTIE
jgi:hypothetical protein